MTDGHPFTVGNACSTPELEGLLSFDAFTLLSEEA